VALLKIGKLDLFKSHNPYYNRVYTNLQGEVIWMVIKRIQKVEMSFYPLSGKVPGTSKQIKKKKEETGKCTSLYFLS